MMLVSAHARETGFPVKCLALVAGWDLSRIDTSPFSPESQHHCIFPVVGVWWATRKKNDSWPERGSAVLLGRTVLSSHPRISSKQILYFMF